jgi:hypothetical protein
VSKTADLDKVQEIEVAFMGKFSKRENSYPARFAKKIPQIL